MEDFKDNFSAHAAVYAQFRPTYPDSLFAFLSEKCSAHELAWDCGTGNGQAATGIAKYFKTVVATEPSAAQVSNARGPANVFFKQEKAEESSLADKSADLITIANALHWFDADLFYCEVKRVLKNDGVIAAWTYKLPQISAGIDKVIANYHDVVLNDFWQPENRLVEKEYKTIPFPFDEIRTPDFFIEKYFTLDELIGFLSTWSATQRYILKNGNDPLPEVRRLLEPFWENAGTAKKAIWKITLKAGRLSIR